MKYKEFGVQTEETELVFPNSDFETTRLKNQSWQHQPMLGTSLHSLKILRNQQSSCLAGGTKKCIFMLLCLSGFASFGFILFAYYCSGPNSLCSIPSHKYSKFYKYITKDIIGQPLETASKYSSLPTFEEVISKDFLFDIEDHDVMVFLHMQKTGGTTFGKHLVKDLQLERDCICHRRVKKRCTCLRPGSNSKETWLFSRYTTGWKCGLHADWTELTSCVDEMMDKIEDRRIKRRYFYITFLRDPIHRYLSEYRHVGRGATWKKSKLICKGRPATAKEVPLCYSGKDWSDVSLEDFVSCKSNLANNRQTRMLADLSLVNCYDTTWMSEQERDTVMLASAKNNLQRMSFFGLTEFQEISQYLFEETFNLKFNIRFVQSNLTQADDALDGIDPALQKKVQAVNHLDLKLYAYAKELMMQRFQNLKKLDHHFQDHYNGMGRSQFSWKEIDNEN